MTLTIGLRVLIAISVIVFRELRAELILVIAEIKAQPQYAPSEPHDW